MANPLPPAPGQAGAGVTTSGNNSFPQQMTSQQIEGVLYSLGVTANEMNLYDTGTALTPAGTALLAFTNLGTGDRLNLQQSLVGLGFLKQADATGANNSATLGALRQWMAQTIGSGGMNSIPQLWQQATSGTSTWNKYNEVGSQINQQAAAASAELGKTQAVTASLENSTKLKQTIQSAFDQALGYAPSQTQIDQFVSQVQGQDVAAAQSGALATQQAAKSDLQRAQAEDSALNKLGPDGVDSFLNAYTQAIHGSAQGPVVKKLPTGQQINPPEAVEPKAVPKLGPVELPTPGAPGAPGAETGRAAGTADVTARAAASPGTPANPGGGPGMYFPPPINSPGKYTAYTPVYGGEFALLPSVWKKAQALYNKTQPKNKQIDYASAGAAPVAIQHAAVTLLAMNLYNQSGSWSSVATDLGGGKGIANQVTAQTNTALENLQTQVNAPGPIVTDKVQAPDAAAEALAAAKQSDPTGYDAANFASWGGLVGKMLFGRPLDQIQSTSDVFTGPVGPAATGPATSGPTTGVAA